ncbi:MAG: hypothetical protein M3R46_06760 [Actinomycetota bacterium]|nr:hypothetical protein [Actinomycetota bacterium]
MTLLVVLGVVVAVLGLLITRSCETTCGPGTEAYVNRVGYFAVGLGLVSVLVAARVPAPLHFLSIATLLAGGLLIGVGIAAYGSSFA